MSDFMSYFFATIIACFFSIQGVEYANGKSKQVRMLLICIIVVIFSAFNAWAMYIHENMIPIAAIEKEWNRYTDYCKENHVSWNEFTFPDWLNFKSEMYFDYFE